MGVMDFINNGQQRRAWLDENVADFVEYITPPNLRPTVEMAAQMNPIQGMSDSMQQFGVATDPNRSMDERRRAAVSSATEGLLAVVPAAVAARGYMTPAQAAMESFVGYSPAAQAAGQMYQIGDTLHVDPSYMSVGNKPALVSIPDAGRFSSKPIGPIEAAARDYMAARGMDATPLTEYPVLDPRRSQLIGAAYDQMRHDPSAPDVRRAYDALIQETMDQYRALEDAGIEFKFLRDGMSDPYARSPAMGYQDLVENGRLWVFPSDFGFGSGSGFDPRENPLLRGVGRVGDKTDAVANDAFRAVHDAFGHFGQGNPYFRAKGEERAWNEHSRMYSPDALGAMTSETRGQNSWLNFGPHGEANRTALGAETIFADQKTGLMPAWTYRETGEPTERELRGLLATIDGWQGG